MHRILQILVSLGFVGNLHAQLLSPTPAFPVDTSSVSIVVDCSKGNQGLFNYANTGDVYVHTGVITSASSGPTDWRHAPFTWGTTNPAAHAVSLGNNKYQYSINNIRSFFGVPAGEKILAIAILFRNGSGALAHRQNDGSEIEFMLIARSQAVQLYVSPSPSNNHTQA